MILNTPREPMGLRRFTGMALVALAAAGTAPYLSGMEQSETKKTLPKAPADPAQAREALPSLQTLRSTVFEADANYLQLRLAFAKAKQAREQHLNPGAEPGEGDWEDPDQPGMPASIPEALSLEAATEAYERGKIELCKKMLELIGPQAKRWLAQGHPGLAVEHHVKEIFKTIVQETV
ncbi:MAG: hypothetical protein ABSH53_07555 [Holophaga sp.]